MSTVPYRRCLGEMRPTATIAIAPRAVFGNQKKIEQGEGKNQIDGKRYLQDCRQSVSSSLAAEFGLHRVESWFRI